MENVYECAYRKFYIYYKSELTNKRPKVRIGLPNPRQQGVVETFHIVVGAPLLPVNRDCSAKANNPSPPDILKERPQISLEAVGGSKRDDGCQPLPDEVAGQQWQHHGHPHRSSSHRARLQQHHQAQFLAPLPQSLTTQVRQCYTTGISNSVSSFS